MGWEGKALLFAFVSCRNGDVPTDDAEPCLFGPVSHFDGRRTCRHLFTADRAVMFVFTDGEFARRALFVIARVLFVCLSTLVYVENICSALSI